MATDRKNLTFEEYESLIVSLEKTYLYKLLTVAQAGLDNCGVCLFCQDCPRLKTCVIKSTCDEIEKRIQTENF